MRRNFAPRPGGFIRVSFPLLKLRPIRLNLYRDGVAISLQTRPGFEYGLHVIPVGVTDDLKSTERTQYEKLQDGIYYFTQKR
jgi:hypothetical protein